MKRVFRWFHRRMRHFSLKKSLTDLVVLCWVLPILAAYAVTEYYIMTGLSQQLDERLTDTLESSVESCSDRLDEAVASSRLATYDPTVHNSLSDYLKKRSFGDFYRQITGFMGRQYQYDDKFAVTMLYFLNSPDYVFYMCNNQLNLNYQSVLDYKQKAKSKVDQVAAALGTRVGFVSADNQIYMVRNLFDSNFVRYGVLVMQLNKQSVFEGISNVVYGTGSQIWLDDATAVLRGKGIDLEKYGIHLPVNAATYENYRGDSLIYGTSRSEDYTLSYAVSVNSGPLTARFRALRGIALGIGLMAIPLLLLVVHYFYVNISRPIGSILKGCHGLENGDFGVQITDKFHSEEFQYFRDAFNRMSRQLRLQFDRIYNDELALKDAQIMALQSQMNPHFLYNTLETINWEARLKGNREVSGMIEALSTLLDAALDRENRPQVPLSEELSFVDAYLYITSVRMGDKLKIEKKIDRSLLVCPVPRLIMQPLVENEIEHGGSVGGVQLMKIRAFRQGGQIFLQLDSNQPMRDEDVEKVKALLSGRGGGKARNSAHLGLNNVQQRLHILYGVRAGLSVSMDERRHTISEIHIPLDRMGAEST